MNNLDRIALFKTTLEQCRSKLASDPTFIPLQSIEKQLVYLIELEEGRNIDRGLLSNISIGLLTAREIETYDMNLADLLYKVTEAVDAMRYGR